MGMQGVTRIAVLSGVLLTLTWTGCLGQTGPSNPSPNVGEAAYPRDVLLKNERPTTQSLSITMTYRSAANTTTDVRYDPAREADEAPGDVVLTTQKTLQGETTLRIEDVADRYGVYRVTASSDGVNETQDWYFGDESYEELTVAVTDDGIGMGWAQTLGSRSGNRNRSENWIRASRSSRP